MANFLQNIGKFFTEKSAFERLGDLFKWTNDQASNVIRDITHVFGQNTAQEQNEFNRIEAQKNRDFQERMSNTSYQRAVADLENSGLNSALAYSQGGASVPSGSSASASASGNGGFVQILGTLLNPLVSITKAAIQANSAKALAQLNDGKATYRDTFKTGNGYRTVTWKE